MLIHRLRRKLRAAYIRLACLKLELSCRQIAEEIQLKEFQLKYKKGVPVTTYLLIGRLLSLNPLE